MILVDCRRTSRSSFLIALLVLESKLISFVIGSAYVQVAATIDEVQEQNAALEIGWALSKGVEAGGYVRITFPEAMTVSEDVSNCRELDGALSFTSCTADVEKNYIELVLAAAMELAGTTTAPYLVMLDDAANLPATIATADPITLTTSAGEVRTTTFTATAGALTAAALTPAVLTVGSDTTVHLSLTTTHAIPRKGKLNVGVSAAWNEGDPDGELAYFSSITCNSFTIGGASVADGSYACSFFDAARVEIDVGFDDGVPGDTDIEIDILGFRNPILANQAFEVFTVYTTGEDETHTVDTLPVAVTVTDPAALTGAVFDVSTNETDNPGMVQEPNSMGLTFSSPVPLREGCVVSYWFPTEFYDADEIVSVRIGPLFA